MRPRKFRPGDRGDLHVYMEVAMVDAIYREAHRREMSASEFIRRLCREELRNPRLPAPP